MTSELITKARFFYPRDSSMPDVLNVLEEVSQYLGLGNYQKQQAILKYLLLDFRKREIELPGGWLAYSRDRNKNREFYEATEPFASLQVTYDPLVSVMDRLISAGLIESAPGFYSFSSFTSRARPTSLLRRYIDRIPEEAVRDSLDYFQAIVLKKRVSRSIKGRTRTRDIRIKLPEDAFVQQIRAEVMAFNYLFRDSQINLANPAQFEAGSALAEGAMDAEVRINFNKKYLYRVFNENLNRGGRFYGAWWQNVPSGARRFILIDDEPTVEVDFKGFHIALLYSLSGIDYFEGDLSRDPYSGVSVDRDDAKLLLQMLLNCSNRMEAIHAYISEKREAGDTPDVELVDAVVKQFEEKHSPIREHFFRGLGIRMQYIDSMIAATVMNDCMKSGILDSDGIRHKFLVLPVHDSFIVKHRHKDQIKRVMQSAVEFNLQIISEFTDFQMSHYVPQYSESSSVDATEYVMDGAYISRKELQAQGLTIPEATVIKRTLSDGTLRFCLC